ncbi:MAG: hypothetical protein ACOYML_02935 [Microthrixaceae bacterium]
MNTQSTAVSRPRQIRRTAVRFAIAAGALGAAVAGPLAGSATADCISLPVGGCATGIELPSAPASIPPMVRTLPPGFGGVIDAPVLTPDGDPTAEAPATDEDPRIPPGKGPGTEEPPKDAVPTDPGASTTTVPAGAQELLPCGPDVATVAFVPCATTTTVPATTDTVPGDTVPTTVVPTTVVRGATEVLDRVDDGPDSLAFTGSNAALPIAGAGLLGAGAALAGISVVARRRRMQGV